MNRIFRFLYRQPSYKLVIIGIALPFLLNVSIVVIGEIFGFDDASSEGYKVNLTNLFTMVLIGPLIETVLAQYLPLKFGGLFFPKYKFAVSTNIKLTLFLLLFSDCWGPP